MKRRRIERLAIAFLFVALCVVFAERASRPPGAIAENAPLTVFSAERAMKHLLAIAQRPHPIGSAEHDRARDYLVAQLSNLGLDPQIQNATGVGTHAQPTPPIYPSQSRYGERKHWLQRPERPTSNGGREAYLGF